MAPSTLTPRERLALRNAYLRRKALRSGKPKKSERELTTVSKTEVFRELRRVGNTSSLLDRQFWKSAAQSKKNFYARPFVPVVVNPTVLHNKVPEQLWASLRHFEKAMMKAISQGKRKHASLDDLITVNRSSGEQLVRHSESTESGNETLLKSGIAINLSASNEQCLSDLTNICIPIVRELLAEHAKQQNKMWVLQEFDHNLPNLPLNISLISYEKGKEQGLKAHVDAYAMFLIVLCVIEESDNGNIHVPRISLSDPLPARSLLLINPLTLHHGPVATRMKRRSVLVLTF